MEEDIWTVRRILAWIEDYLAKHGIENARLSAQWLVAEALGISRMQLFMDMERPLTADERAVLRDFTRRRGTGEPLQYITGTVDFRHVTLKVKPGVLIPRPETEVLVSEALALLPAPAKPQDALDEALVRQYLQLKAGAGELTEEDAPEYLDAPDALEGLLVADLCTGSGCIACSIAFEHPKTRVVATDLSPEAVALASENAQLLGLSDRVDILECDLASGIEESLLGTFDLIVSNPPYVPTIVLDEIPDEVSDFEPSLALDGGPDGLDIFRRLLPWCFEALKHGGSIAVELHETCLDQAAEEARQAGFVDIQIKEDLTQRPRILIARKA
ncbi:MAG: peptide chain release factor N(5)-glutamine methyltransferase [Eggerthellaceae bacterium]|nr:peptide chain release factor N(5)-glutamine methyltransferase [Eggerthellaceae bacterium]